MTPTPTVFITRAGARYSALPVTPEQAAAVGCPQATHRLTGRTGQTWARWTPSTGRRVRMPWPGWADAGRCATHGTFTAAFNADGETAVAGHLVTHPRPYVPAQGSTPAQRRALGL